MRFVRLVALSLSLVAVPVSAQRGGEPTPLSGVAVQDYPILPQLVGVAAIKKMAELDLHPVILKEEWIGHNYYRNLRRYVLDTIHAGEMVYADRFNTPRYKASCWNKLAELPKCEKCLATNQAMSLDSAAVAHLIERVEAESRATSPGFWAAVGHNIGALWDFITRVMSWLIPLLLLLLVGWLLWQLIRGMVQGGGGTPGGWFAPRPAVGTPQTLVPVAPPVVATSNEEAVAAVPVTPASTAPATPAAVVDANDGHTVHVTMHKDGSHTVRSSAGVRNVSMGHNGENNVLVTIGHEGHNN